MFDHQQFKDAWVEALRSGEYKQGTECLYASDSGHCCLGVAVRVLEEKFPEFLSSLGFAVVISPWPSGDGQSMIVTDGEVRESLALPNRLRAALGLGYDQAGLLMNMNDKQGLNFNEIADYISSTDLTREPSVL